MNFQLLDFSLLFSGLSVMISSTKIMDRWVLMLFVLLAVVIGTLAVWSNGSADETPDTFANGMVEHVEKG